MKKINIIFDTDAGADCDDMMALGYLIYAQECLGISIKAVTHSHVSPHGAAAIRGTFRYFGKQAPPVGVMVGGNAFDDHYVGELDRRFAPDADRAPAPNAVSVLRRALAESDGDVVICAVGPLTNIAALLESVPDEISPLNGVELVREKCSKAVLMAGMFVPDKQESLAEWNVKCDIPSAQTVADRFPAPLFWLPFETGIDMITGKPIMDKYGMCSPVSASFILFPWAKDGRNSWDPAAALYAVEGERELFTVLHGDVCIDVNGVSHLNDNAEAVGGVIVMNTDKADELTMKKRAAEYLDSVVLKIHPKI